MTKNTRKENFTDNAPVPDIPAAGKSVQKPVKVSKSVRELIPMNEFGMMATKDRVVRVDSRMVTETFEKEHKNVLRDIERITDPKSGLSLEFTQLNFELSKYVDQTGRKLPCYLLTRDGLSMLAMEFTGEKANAFKERYIQLFNEMEEQLLTLQNLSDNYPALTEAIKETRETVRPYDYSNEADMLNRIVLGMTAKQYRETHGIPQGEPIRPHMTPQEADLMEYLQTVDVGFQYAIPVYHQRKQALEALACQWCKQNESVWIDSGTSDVSLLS